ncbi:outer membrane protein assembly factor BamC [Azomonas macrocytogenes]|uniref:outer membrane protein assembly factor BamC n=1 Tax=Azomonas macrocytogenes TaxID=69962 RepID=UPI001605D0FE|nr:outer membrane protein assembly factor BamC [Azomonas macrocytogenes]
MRRLVGFFVLALLASANTGCSLVSWIWGKDGYFYDRASDYRDSRLTAPMETPSGISSRPLEPLLPIPARVADPRHEEEYEIPRPQKVLLASQTNDFSVQSSDGQYSLVAFRTPAQLWISVRQFLSEYGFDIAEEHPQAGELVTAWQSGSAYIPSIRQNASKTDETRIRIRIEPGVQRNTSEVSVQSAEKPSGTSDLSWPASSINPRLDSAILDELQASLTRNAETGDSISLLAQREFDAPDRVDFIQDASGNPLLQLDTDFNRAWSRVGRALESADVRVDDLNRSLGVYYINLAEGADKTEDQPGFFSRFFGWGSNDKTEREKNAERYQIRLSEVANGIQISVEKDLNTLAPPDVARRVLSLLQKNLSEPERRTDMRPPGAQGPRNR